MKPKLHAYEQYTPTAVAWAPTAPSHWAVLPNRAVFSEVNNRGHAQEQMLSVTISSGVITQADFLSEGSKKDSSNENKDAYKLVEPGDIAYNKMRAWQGAIGASSLRGIVSPAYIVMRPRERQNASYFHHLFRTPAFTTAAERWSYGIVSDQWSLRADDFKQIYCLVPPLGEQQAIARYIAHIDKRFSRLIRNKRRLIALLNEEKQAIIQQAVTRGLDPDVPMKPSGVEWLGEIPAHWEVRRARFLFREIDVRSITGEETHLSMSQKHGLIPSAKVEERRLMSDSYVGGKTVRTTELVLNRLKAHLGVFAVAKQDGVVSPDYTVLRPGAGANVDYYESVLRTPACRMELRRRTKGIVEGFWRLYTDDFYDIPIPVPSFEDQHRIVSELDAKTAEIGSLTERIVREIDLIQEYRTRLIADVVTGQLDVRNVQIDDAEWSVEEFDGYHPGLADKEVPVIGETDELFENESDVA